MRRLLPLDSVGKYTFPLPTNEKGIAYIIFFILSIGTYVGNGISIIRVDEKINLVERPATSVGSIRGNPARFNWSSWSSCQTQRR